VLVLVVVVVVVAVLKYSDRCNMSVSVTDASADDVQEQKRRLEDELIKDGRVSRLIRLHHLLQDEEQLKRWTELSPKLASTFDGRP